MKGESEKLIMSEYAGILIGNLSLYWFRNYLDSKIVSAELQSEVLVCKIKFLGADFG